MRQVLYCTLLSIEKLYPLGEGSLCKCKSVQVREGNHFFLRADMLSVGCSAPPAMEKRILRWVRFQYSEEVGARQVLSFEAASNLGTSKSDTSCS